MVDGNGIGAPLDYHALVELVGREIARSAANGDVTANVGRG